MENVTSRKSASTQPGCTGMTSCSHENAYS
jgi:hypothetical protein